MQPPKLGSLSMNIFQKTCFFNSFVFFFMTDLMVQDLGDVKSLFGFTLELFQIGLKGRSLYPFYL